jgi:hypothetical protein
MYTITILYGQFGLRICYHILRSGIAGDSTVIIQGKLNGFLILDNSTDTALYKFSVITELMLCATETKSLEPKLYKGHNLLMQR